VSCGTLSLNSTPSCGVGGPTSATQNSNRKFALIDSYVHLRLSKLASVKYATRGRLRASRFQLRWLTELGIYRLHRKSQAMDTCACLTMTVSESRVRENRMHGLIGGPLGKLTHPAGAAGPGPVR